MTHAQERTVKILFAAVALITIAVIIAVENNTGTIFPLIVSIWVVLGIIGLAVSGYIRKIEKEFPLGADWHMPVPPVAMILIAWLLIVSIGVCATSAIDPGLFR